MGVHKEGQFCNFYRRKNPLQRATARTRGQTKLNLSQNMCLVCINLFLDMAIRFEVLEFSPNFSTEPYRGGFWGGGG